MEQLTETERRLSLRLLGSESNPNRHGLLEGNLTSTRLRGLEGSRELNENLQGLSSLRRQGLVQLRRGLLVLSEEGKRRLSESLGS